MANRGTRVDVSELAKGLQMLSGAKESLARTMGNAMGVEVRDEAKLRAPVMEPGNEGTDGQIPGKLKRSIYNAYDERYQYVSPNSFRYTVSWNSSRTHAPYGHLVEFGFLQPYVVRRTVSTNLFYTPPGADGAKGILRDDGPLFVRPQPFLGPAFDAQLPRLLSIAQTAGSKRFSELTNGTE